MMTEEERLARQIPGYDPWRNSEGWTFDPERAADAIGFFSAPDGILTFADGPKAGERFILEDWQRAIIANLYGWHRGKERRYKETFIFVPRKNGKTPLAAGLLLLEMCMFPTVGGQYFSAAADREQAALIFRDACQMIRNEEPLRQRFNITPSYKLIESKGGHGVRYRALSSDAGTKHGLRPCFVVVDELHAHPNADLVDTMTTGTAVKGMQPLVVYITTSDYQRESVCNTKYAYACRVRDGEIDDSRYLPVIYEATRTDDWKSEDTWRKANPNYDVSVSADYLKRECERAQHEAAYENTFKRLHLNIQTEANERLIRMDEWDRCATHVDPQSLLGRPCFAGLDLSTEKDLSAFVLVFPEDDYKVLPFFWLPFDNAETRQKHDGVPYKTWLDQGHIEPTSGDYVSHQAIGDRIEELSADYDIRTIAFDRAQAAAIYERIEGYGLTMLKHPQTLGFMNGPFRELLARLGNCEIIVGDNPCLRWMASNLQSYRDSNDRIRPDRAKSTEKIDGMVALMMALSAAGQDTSFTWYEPGALAL